MIWYGVHCRRPVSHLSKNQWRSNVWQLTPSWPSWSHSYSMARRGVTVTDTVAPSYTLACHLPVQPQQPNAKKRNILKSPATVISFPFETFGPINRISTEFNSALGHRISSNTDDPWETIFLFQRLSVAIQHFDAVWFAHLFGNVDVEMRRNQPRHT